jgi:hypothetical protein
LSDSKVTDVPQQPESDCAEGAPKEDGLHVDLTKAKNAPQMFSDFDNFQQFKLQTTLDFINKLSNQLEKGTAIYEKLILLDGATIALSITVLVSLSSRWADVRNAERPHLWMVDVSWCLLIFSIFCSYQVIVRRHSATLSMFLKFSSEFTNYIYLRVGVVVSYLKHVLNGEVPYGTETVDISKVLEVVPTLLNQEKETSLKKISDTISLWRDGASKEGVFAKLAVYCTIVAVAFLCIFTILSLRLLF